MFRATLVSLLVLAPAAASGQTYPPPVIYPPDPAFNINLYITEPSYTGCLVFDDGEVGECTNLVSDPVMGPAFVWVVVSRFQGFPIGIGGVEFGIQHDNITVLDWALCTDGLQVFGNDWPQSGGVTAITWTAGCYYPPGDVAKTGYFIVEDASDGFMKILDDGFFQPRAVWADCIPAGFEIDPDQLGSAELSEGTEPTCYLGSTPVVASSWTAVKAHFK